MFTRGDMTNLDESLYYYRITPGSITTLPLKQNKRRKMLITKALINKELSDDEISELTSLKSGLSSSDLLTAYNLRIGKSLIEDEWNPKRARNYLYKAVRISPYSLVAWINIFLTFLPILIVRKWKNKRLKLIGRTTHY